MLKALAEFRCGNFRTALESLPATRPMDNPPERATVDLIRALARDALGHRAEASAALGRANDTIRRRVPKPGVGDLRPWGLESWLLCQVIRREAEAKLQAQSTSPR